MSTTAPYGTWPSALSPELLFERATGLTELRRDGDRIAWLELRSGEGGRQALVVRADDAHHEPLPQDVNARTRVHEYGGGSYLQVDGVTWYSDFTDQRLYRAEPGQAPRPITPEPAEPSALRYADLELHPDGGWLLAVRERHEGPDATDVHNELVAIPADGAAVDGDGEVVVLAGGHDFVSSPRLHADGVTLAYVAWNHPNMPWDDTSLVLGRFVEVAGRPRLEDPVTVVGAPGASESVMAPSWGPDGSLYLLSDRTGWWNLYRLEGLDLPRFAADREAGTATPELEPTLRNLAPVRADLGFPAWQFGPAPYAALDDGRFVVISTDQAVMRPSILDPTARTVTALPVPHTACRGVVAAGRTVTMLAGSPSHPDSLVEVEVPPADRPLEEVEWRTLHASRELPVEESWLSQPEVISFPTSDGMTAYALYHAPRNPEVTGPDDELPPLIVTSHGGPTAHVPPRLDLAAAFWTSRGFAVVDVNYRGSSGFGREYREALRGTWGVYDLDDCVAAATALAERGAVDPDRKVIRGGSASGFTTLAALTFRDVFDAGASYFGVADLGALAEETHKFESRYLDRLVGPYPAAIDTYRDRSPVHHPEGLSCPIILLQGMLDRIVPPAQAEAMVEAMRARGVPHAYVTFPDEDHGFRKAENQLRALTAELSFYAQVFGFEPADDLEPIEVVGLAD